MIARNRKEVPIHAESCGEHAMSKGADIKKEAKKKPTKTLKEKKAEKKAKKETQRILA